jgi:hypothetical protein
MGMLEILANSQNIANESFLNSVQQATGAWGGLMDNLTYKAAGNELIALMQTKPADQDIEPMDIIKVAQKYKLPQEKMMGLMKMLDTSGALRAAQQERRLAMKDAKAKEDLVDETGLPSDVAGDIVKAGAKPQTGKTWGEVRIAGPDDPNAQEGSRYQISSDGAVKILDQGDLGSGFNTYHLTPEEHEALGRAITIGGLDPYKVNSRTAKIYARQELENPGTDWNKLGAQATYERSVGATNTKTLLNSITPLFDELLVKGKELNNTRWPLINKPINWLKEQSGNEDIVAFNNLRDDAVAELERGLLGTGVLSDSKYNRAIKNINSAQSYDQLVAAVENTMLVIKERLKAVEHGPHPGILSNSDDDDIEWD